MLLLERNRSLQSESAALRIANTELSGKSCVAVRIGFIDTGQTAFTKQNKKNREKVKGDYEALAAVQVVREVHTSLCAYRLSFSENTYLVMFAELFAPQQPTCTGSLVEKKINVKVMQNFLMVWKCCCCSPALHGREEKASLVFCKYPSRRST